MRKKFALIATVVLFVFAGLFFYIVRDTGRIYDNVSVLGVDLSNTTKEEAKKKIDGITLENVKLNYEGREFTISGDTIGYKADSDSVTEEAYNVWRKGNFLKNKINIFASKIFGKKITIPLYYTLNEEALRESIAKIASEVDVKEQNAKLKVENNQISIISERAGKKLNVNKTLNSVKENIKNGTYNNIELVTEVSVPKVTKEKLNTVDTLLGEYSTTFNSGVQGRSENIKVATNAINDVYLESEEIISFNDRTGMRSLENGYKKAPVIINGELEPGLGGGVCQVSTTLFNAGALSGMKIVERRNHSIPSSYVALGRDAVVDYGNLDLKMQNTFKHPVYLISEVSGNKITIKVYGNNKDKSDDVKLFAVVNGSIPRSTKTVTYGKPSNGRDGIKATTYRVTVKNGTEKKEVLSSNYYPAKARVIVLSSEESTASSL